MAKQLFFIFIFSAVLFFLSSCNTGAFSSFSYTDVPQQPQNNNPSSPPGSDTLDSDGGGINIEIVWPWDKK